MTMTMMMMSLNSYELAADNHDSRWDLVTGIDCGRFKTDSVRSSEEMA